MLIPDGLAELWNLDVPILGGLDVTSRTQLEGLKHVFIQDFLDIEKVMGVDLQFADDEGTYKPIIRKNR